VTIRPCSSMFYRLAYCGAARGGCLIEKVDE
jgi:hypothetical protein